MPLAFLRKMLTWERLPPPPASTPGRARRRWAALLLRPEPLPEAPPPSPARPARPGLLRLLLAPEPLPRDPPAPARRRGRWLAWLLFPERLDDR
ncbi:MAG TPA: hypothetical protein VML50_18435 [Anaeromyxobacter sp.]|nr:hypothetical protein [Anaeromyxobacter sp.]